MGAVYYGIPTKLADDLRVKYGLSVFVESGLGQGTTALWAESRFDTVISIETDGKSVARFRRDNPQSKVRVIEGDSTIEMAGITTRLQSPALFWLDGHTDDFNPIMAELAAIHLSKLPHVIMVDDWRMFGTCAKWPSKEKVIAFSTSRFIEGRWTTGGRWAYDVDDVLVVEPI